MISSFVASYGYLAVFLGTLLEGETILLAAGYAAHRGLLDWPLVALVAFLGATIGDQLAFMLGRWKGAALVAHSPALAERAPRVHALLKRHDAVFIIGVRFMYGLRTAGPVVMGTSRVPLLRFATFNMLGAALWALMITGAGYFFGAVSSSIFTDLQRYEEIVLVGILATGLLFWLVRRMLKGRSSRRDTGNT